MTDEEQAAENQRRRAIYELTGYWPSDDSDD